MSWRGRGRHRIFLPSFILLLFLFILLLLPPFIFGQEAQQKIALALQKIQESNQQYALDFSAKAGLAIAFLAGVLGILSPCILPFLPAYFSYTFKEKKNITLMTLVFFLGFTLVFVAMGAAAGFLGEQTILAVQTPLLMKFTGAFLVAMGIITLLGKGFSSFIRFSQKKPRHDTPGVFLFGVFYALGWSACLGPILAGILSIGAILHNPLQSGLLLFFYSLGNLVPLFLISVFYDKLNLSRFLQGRLHRFSLFGKEFLVPTTSIISGILFVILGIVVFVFNGTNIVNTWDVLGTKQFFYDLQNMLLRWKYAGITGAGALAVFLAFVGWFFLRQRKRKIGGKSQE
ncbi:cytochrome c biogenesis protein CcdA [Candidatus Woesearchaeota archaeon]|nr:cytochrome c biogenesis protein CcdA [Candidatus Woesearchaeota archaeon]